MLLDSTGINSDAGHSVSEGHAEDIDRCLRNVMRMAGAIDASNKTVFVDGKSQYYYTGQTSMTLTNKARYMMQRTGLSWTIHKVKLPEAFPKLTKANCDGFEAVLNNIKINSCPNSVSVAFVFTCLFD